MTNPPKTPLERKEGRYTAWCKRRPAKRGSDGTVGLQGLVRRARMSPSPGTAAHLLPPAIFFSSSRTSAERFKSSFVCNFVETKATISRPSARVSNPKAKCCAKGAAQQTGDWNAVPGCRAVRGAYR